LAEIALSSSGSVDGGAVSGAQIDVSVLPATERAPATAAVWQGEEAVVRGTGATRGASSSAGASVQVCSLERHVCGPTDAHRGCASCGFTCHADCTSELCAYVACPYCVSRSLVTHENSLLCLEAQRYNVGCHACGNLGCCLSSATCHARCTPRNHVCEVLPPGMGCTSCDKACHRSNADPRCEFYQRPRDRLAWSASAQQLLDTQAGTGGSVPHFSQIPWKFLNRARSEVLIDGVLYQRGYGNPGDEALGERNNCLIDSLRQCLNIECNRLAVRRDLQAEFGNANVRDPRRNVTRDSYLDVELHWGAIVRSLFRHNTSGNPRECDLDDYCVVALYGNNPDNGGFVGGRLDAPNRLVVVNWGDVHFDPCLRR
jgi:hypothetical protein